MTAPTIFNVGGEAGAEAIVPLHAGPETLKKMDEKIDYLMNRNQTIVVNIAGHEVKNVIDPMIDSHIVSRGEAGITNTQRVAF